MYWYMDYSKKESLHQLQIFPDNFRLYSASKQVMAKIGYSLFRKIYFYNIDSIYGNIIT